MSTHVLKTRTPWFERVIAGEKTAEVRRHDRDFQVGDVLHLVEVDDRGWRVQHYEPGRRGETGRFASPYYTRWADVRVTHVLPAALGIGLAEGYCLLSIELVEVGP